jgi:hypothetical protein
MTNRTWTNNDGSSTSLKPTKWKLTLTSKRDVYDLFSEWEKCNVRFYRLSNDEGRRVDGFRREF